MHGTHLWHESFTSVLDACAMRVSKSTHIW